MAIRTKQGGLTIENDGTNITISSGGIKLFRVVISTGQFEVAGGFTSDATL